MAENDPATGGGNDPAQKGGGEAGAEGALTAEAVQKLVSSGIETGMKAMEETMQKAITGAGQRHNETLLKSDAFGTAISEHVAAGLKAANAKPAADPTAMEALTNTVASLDSQVKQQNESIAEKDAAILETSRISALGDTLTDMTLTDEKSFRALAANGLLPGLKAKPIMDNGELVYKTESGESKSAKEVLDGYLKTNTHWLTQHTASGSGAGGSAQSASTGLDEYVFDPSSKGQKSTIAALQANPEKAVEAMESAVAKKSEGIYFP